MSIQIKRKLFVNKNLDLNCKVWKKKDGYLAYNGCEKIKVKKLTRAWEAIFPAPLARCGYTNPLQNPLCAAPLIGFNHPHVYMVDDYFYRLNIDLE